MNKKTKEVISEISKRVNEKLNDNIIGNELRMHRLDQNITLSSLSKDTCSTSYLSKIETNQITPNKVFLEEICNKLSMDNGNIDALYKSKDNVKNCIIAFLHDDEKVIRKVVDESKGLINYRVKVVDFIYYIIDNNIINANKVYNLLAKNVKSMNDFDLATFCLFSGIYHFKTEHFDDAKLELKNVKELTTDSDILMLKDLYIFYLDLKQSRADAVVDYNIIYRKLNDCGFYQLMEKISYYLGCYYCKFSLENGYYSVINRIQNQTYINTLKFLYSFYKKDIVRTNYKKDEVSDYVKALINLKKNKAITIDILESKDSRVDLDFEYYYIEYLLLDDDKKSDEILNYFAPIVEVTQDEFLIHFFYNELIKYCEIEGRYKRIYEFHKIINKSRK